MPGRALSKTKQRQQHVEDTEKWIKKAVDLYWEEKGKPGGWGLHSICKEMEEECFQVTQKKITLHKSTLQRCVQGGQSKQEVNANRCWLTEEETEAVLTYATNLADRGFPLSQRCLREHVNEICRARYGDQFPEGGVGKQWIPRFIEKHSDQLKPYWSRPLDKSRARAVNPVTKEAFFTLLKDVIDGNEGQDPIPPGLIYGADESGLQEGIGTRERVYGPVGKKVQHQQRSGTRENITVIAAICADGSTLPPAVIFKGEGFQVSWKQDNPLNASLGYSRKGYTDREISEAWLESFDKHTCNKAAGRRRLLLVDGHSSHYTWGFLEYAQKHLIHVLCYPSHSTHVYQGLDVVIFSVLKRAWSDARDDHERRTGADVDKSNFLSVYAKAHLQAFTRDNVLAAFRKTGVVPFNPNVITSQMMAPSLETSTRDGAALPIPQTSPVRAISNMIYACLDNVSSASVTNNNVDLPRLHTPSTPPAQVTIDQIRSTSASFLTDATPLQSTSKPPSFIPFTISPMKKNRNSNLLDLEPMNIHEWNLQKALKDAETRDYARKEAVINLQATAMLQGMYAKKAQARVQALEEKGKKKKPTRRLFGDGMPKLLDHPTFVARVVEHEERQVREAANKAERKRCRENRSAELAVWKMAEKERKAQNNGKRLAYQASVETWEKEHDQAKLEHRRPLWKKPKVGPLEAPIPKPTFSDDEGENEESSGSDQARSEADLD